MVNIFVKIYESIPLAVLCLEKDHLELSEVEVDVVSVKWCDGRPEVRTDDAVPSRAEHGVKVTPDVIGHVPVLVVAAAAS